MSSDQSPRSTTTRHLAPFTSETEIQPGIAENGESARANLADQVPSRDLNYRLNLNGRATSPINEGSEELRSHEVLGRRRHRPRNSGGFLLPSASVRNTQPRPSTRSLDDVTGDVKGKRKAEDGELFVPESRLSGRRHRLKHSLGGSPLSTEVYNSPPTRGSKDAGRSDPDEISPLPPETLRTSGSLRSTTSGDTEIELKNIDQSQRTVRDTRSALGADTDPVQIVNLALNLSENRRRNFSGGHLSPIYPAGSRRFVSLNQPSAGLSGDFPVTTTGGSLRQHLQDQRRISRRISPRASKVHRQGAESPQIPRGSNSSPQPTAIPTFDVGLSDGTFFNPTEATLSRAENAKLALELSYEYRRLLQYLPNIPVRPGSRSTTSKSSKTNPVTSTTLGRAYNPLQYIRNRRTRAREKKTLDAEEAGWKDIGRVRSWVDTVASEREAGMSRVDDHYPLPPYDVVLLDQALVETAPVLGASHSTGQSSNRSRKLPGSWTITPWDLLADAYWLGQNHNIKRIEDSTGNKIFSGLEILSDMPPRTSQDRGRASKRPLETFRKHTPIENLGSAPAVTLESPRERGHSRKGLHELQSPMHSHNSSLDRKGRWPRNLIRSRSSSSSDHSPTDEVMRHRQGYHGHDGFDSAALRKQMNDILKKEAEEALFKKSDIAHEFHVKPLAQDQADGTISLGEFSRTELEGTRKNRWASEPTTASARVSVDKNREHEPRTSLESARNSSSVHGSSPKIAINSVASVDQPSSPKKGLPPRLVPLRPNRSKETLAISQHDFASESKSSTNMTRHEDNTLKPGESLQSRISNDGLLSPDFANVLDGRTRRYDNSSVKNVKIARDSDSRLRGFLKGGRLAELMGTEMSRVSDIFLRRDRNDTSSPVSPTVSNFATDDSEYDEDTSGLDSPPNAPLSRATTNNEDMARLSQRSTNTEQPKYHMDNLPSFRSPFGRGDNTTDSKEVAPEQDHITRQQLQQRQRGRSQRFDRLAPPKIDMRNVSPSASPPMSGVQTREAENSNDDSCRSSTSRSDYRAQSADRRLNEVLGAPGTIGRTAPPPTGLSGLESRQYRPKQRPDLEKGRQWSISDCGVSRVRGTITKRDIAHVRALLLSSGVKANEIVRRAHTTSEVPSSFLKGLKEISSGPVPSVPRSQEHRLAARILVNNIELTNQKVRDMAEHFSNTAVENLHRRIKAIDERVTRNLTHMVRTAANDADSLGAQLTTTHTLAVKQLNDAVDVILRRRRRRLRWLRRTIYALLEWTLLGIMWWVWFIVVLVRLARGVLRGVFLGVRWFLWM